MATLWLRDRDMAARKSTSMAAKLTPFIGGSNAQPQAVQSVRRIDTLYLDRALRACVASNDEGDVIGNGGFHVVASSSSPRLAGAITKSAAIDARCGVHHVVARA